MNARTRRHRTHRLAAAIYFAHYHNILSLAIYQAKFIAQPLFQPFPYCDIFR
jgi:predicted amidophosphoribosyltransferase